MGRNRQGTVVTAWKGTTQKHLVISWVPSLSTLMGQHLGYASPTCGPALPLLQMPFPAPGSHFPWDWFCGAMSIQTKSLKERTVAHTSSNGQHLVWCLAHGWRSNASWVSGRWMEGLVGNSQSWGTSETYEGNRMYWSAVKTLKKERDV